MFSLKLCWFPSLRSSICHVATLATIFGFTFTSAAQAQTYTVLHTFTGAGDGAHPAGLAMDHAGNLYGASKDYPNPGVGLIFKMANHTSGWTLVPLYNFAAPNDGKYPNGVVIGPEGRLYGTTSDGGAGGYGTVFSLSPPPAVCRNVLCLWDESILVNFYENEYPQNADLAFDANGNVYGTTPSGGDGQCFEFGCGLVYELSPGQGGWTETLLTQFDNGTDYDPVGGVVLDSAGNVYGTASEGGSMNCGTVFQLQFMNGAWTKNTIFNFDCATTGGNPVATLRIDASGNLYGATFTGGTGLGGTVFELSPSGGGWTFNLLYSLTGVGGIDGPTSITRDAAGNIYGVTQFGGAFGDGNVFKLTANNGSYSYASLYDFPGGADGAGPSSSVLLDAQGNLYGSTSGGGSQSCSPSVGCGVVFKITP